MPRETAEAFARANWLFVEPSDDLVRAMLSMAREQDFRQQCSHAAREYALNILSPERYVRKVAGCYESLWERNGFY